MIKTTSRNLILSFHRFLLSIYWLLLIIIKNRNSNTSSQILKNFKLKSSDIHIICPGPSIEKILDHELNNDDIYIFVNHAVSYTSKKNFNNVKKIFFTSDPSRASEIVNEKYDSFKKCLSILTPGHLFHMNHKIFKNFDYIYQPNITIDSKYGLVGKSIESNKIEAPDRIFTGYGFGSLISAVTFSLLFKPNNINFWGCDFGPVDGKFYGTENTNVTEKTPYNLIKNTIDTIDKKLPNINFNFN